MGGGILGPQSVGGGLASEDQKVWGLGWRPKAQPPSPVLPRGLLSWGRGSGKKAWAGQG